MDIVPTDGSRSQAFLPHPPRLEKQESITDKPQKLPKAH